MPKSRFEFEYTEDLASITEVAYQGSSRWLLGASAICTATVLLAAADFSDALLVFRAYPAITLVCLTGIIAAGLRRSEFSWKLVRGVEALPRLELPRLVSVAIDEHGLCKSIDGNMVRTSWAVIAEVSIRGDQLWLSGPGIHELFPLSALSDAAEASALVRAAESWIHRGLPGEMPAVRGEVWAEWGTSVELVNEHRRREGRADEVSPMPLGGAVLGALVAASVAASASGLVFGWIAGPVVGHWIARVAFVLMGSVSWAVLFAPDWLAKLTWPLMLWRRPSLRARGRMVADATGIVWGGVGGRSETEWKRIHEVVWTPKSCWIKLLNGSELVVPRPAFHDEALAESSLSTWMEAAHLAHPISTPVPNAQAEVVGPAMAPPDTSNPFQPPK